jgi:CheY-like chemotaxis protein
VNEATTVTTEVSPSESEASQADAVEAAAASSNARILLVDDNQASRMMFVRVIEKHWPAFRVVVAANDAEASTALTEGSFDWVVVDIVMPDFDGIEFAGRVIANGTSPERVIIMSASDYELRRVEGAGLGPVGRCPKPVRADKLVPFFGIAG